MAEIGDWKDYYAGQRCFILGNGPSLASMNLTHLKNEVTFGTNSIALLFPPRHMVLCAKTILVSKHWQDIARLGVDMADHSFVSKRMTALGLSPESVTIIPVSSKGEWFSDDPIVKPFCKIFSSGTVMQQLAVYLGCNPIYMIGFDGGYVAQEEGEGDPNHFTPGYWGDDFRTITRNWANEINKSSMRGHVFAKEYCDTHGIEIYNATPAGNVDTYERVNYDEIR